MVEKVLSVKWRWKQRCLQWCASDISGWLRAPRTNSSIERCSEGMSCLQQRAHTPQVFLTASQRRACLPACPTRSDTRTVPVEWNTGAQRRRTHRLIRTSSVNKLCGRPPQYAPPPASWPLTLKVVQELRVTWTTSVPILVFLGLSVLDLGPMYVTDRRQTSNAHHRLMPLTLRAGT